MLRTTAEREGGRTMSSASYIERFVHPEDRAAVSDEIRRTIEDRDSTFSRQMEHRIIYGDGEIGHFAIRFLIARDTLGRAIKTYGVYQDISERKQAEMDLRQSFERVQRAVSGAINALGLMAETRDPYTSGHQQRVAQIAVGIARELGLPNEQLETLHVAGVLHDIGKVSVPSEILSKPTTLNEIEFCLLRNHSQVGFEIVKTLDLPWAIDQIVLQHHERINGSGYPLGTVRRPDRSLGQDHGRGRCRGGHGLPSALPGGPGLGQGVRRDLGKEGNSI